VPRHQQAEVVTARFRCHQPGPAAIGERGTRAPLGRRPREAGPSARTSEIGLCHAATDSLGRS